MRSHVATIWVYFEIKSLHVSIRDHEITIFNRPTDVKGTHSISAGDIQKKLVDGISKNCLMILQKLFDGTSKNCLNFTGNSPVFYLVQFINNFSRELSKHLWNSISFEQRFVAIFSTWHWNMWFRYDTYRERWHFNAYFYLLRVWIVNYKSVTLKGKMEKKWDAFSSFDVLYFRKKKCRSN